MTTNLTEFQKLKMSIVENLNFDVEKAKQVYNFVMADEQTENQVCKRTSLPDGVYYVLKGGHLTTTDDPDSIADNVIGVAVKMGERIATVALHYAANGKEIALTNDENSGTEEFYHPYFFDAITDWNGKGNTEDYGNKLNPKIGLKKGQYIPSLAQLHLMLLNINEVNEALKAVDGSLMIQDWHWSSTEGSAYNSWYVNFYNGHSGTNRKSGTYVVRPAVAISI